MKISSEATLLDRGFVALQTVLPTRLISTAMFKLANSKHPTLSQTLIRLFAQQFNIDMTQAVHERLEDYSSFATFFTRALKPSLRPLPTLRQALASPVDGTVSQCAPIRDGRIVQAKGVDYSVAELLGSAVLAEQFAKGSFATIYLSPRDYHRIHMPLEGHLVSWTYMPGRLFSVNPATVRALDGVFVRNERISAVFDTEYGPMAIVMVGAMCVGGMETVWAGPVTPPHLDDLPMVHTTDRSVHLARGAEMGRFNLGSTVIVLLANDAAKWHGCKPGTTLRMGQMIAELPPLEPATLARSSAPAASLSSATAPSAITAARTAPPVVTEAVAAPTAPSKKLRTTVAPPAEKPIPAAEKITPKAPEKAPPKTAEKTAEQATAKAVAKKVTAPKAPISPTKTTAHKAAPAKSGTPTAKTPSKQATPPSPTKAASPKPGASKKRPKK